MGIANGEKTSFKYGRLQLSFRREDYCGAELPDEWRKKVQKVLECICSPNLSIQGQLELRDSAARWSIMIKDCSRTEKVLPLLKADARLSRGQSPLTMKSPRREENEPRRPLLRRGEERRNGGNGLGKRDYFAVTAQKTVRHHFISVTKWP